MQTSIARIFLAPNAAEAKPAKPQSLPQVSCMRSQHCPYFAFIYQPESGSWAWQIHNVREDGADHFARVTFLGLANQTDSRQVDD